jgi:hypothetical protein
MKALNAIEGPSLTPTSWKNRDIIELFQEMNSWTVQADVELIEYARFRLFLSFSLSLSLSLSIKKSALADQTLAGM